MEFRILGPLEVTEQGVSLALGPPLRRLMLAVLLCRPNQAVSQDRLVELLWAGRPPRTAAKNVQVHVYHLRKVLGDDRIRRESHGYLLRVEPGERDADRFEEAVGAGLLAGRSGDAEAARAGLRRALAHWRGAVLAEFADAPALRRDVSRWEGRRLQAVEALVDAELALGNHAELIDQLGQHVAGHPLRERFRAQLMLALYRAGRRSEALAVYQEGRRLLVGELGLEPGPELRELQRAILAGEPAGPGRAGAALLRLPPLVLPTLVDREADLAEVPSLLTKFQLVTLTGAPGIGKTRLALEVAARASADYPDGLGLVRLDTVTDPSRLPAAVVISLGLPDDPLHTPEQILASALADADALVVLDNCEHLAAGCAELLSGTLAACPRLRVLATSREPLDIGPERVHVVRPLEVPAADTVDAVAGSAAGQLLVSRASRADPNFELTGDNAGAIARVCRTLDGVPLAIELAAGRLRALTIWQVADRLDRLPDVLGSRQDGSRHRSLRAALDWSYELLGDTERHTLARLSVFLGGFSLEAAEAVVSDPGTPPGSVLDALASLVERSLVIAETDSVRPSELRYRMLEALRQYAAERLAEGPDERALRVRHAMYFRELAERSGERRGSARVRWIERLQQEYPNLRGATMWTHANGEHELSLGFVGALWWFWVAAAAGVAGEGIVCVRATFKAVSDAGAVPTAEVLQRGLLGAGIVALRVDIAESRAYFDQALQLAQERDDRRGQIMILIGLSSAELVAGNWSAVRSQVDRAVHLAEEYGDPCDQARSLLTRGRYEAYRGSASRARTDLDDALRLYRASGNAVGEHKVRCGQVEIAWLYSDAEAMRAVLGTAVASIARGTYPWDDAVVWLGHAWLALVDGDGSAALEHLARAFAAIGNEYPGPFIAQRIVSPGLAIAAARALDAGHGARAVTLLTGARAILRSFGGVPFPAVARWEETLLQRTRGVCGDQERRRAAAAGQELGLAGLLRLAELPVAPAWERPP